MGPEGERIAREIVIYASFNCSAIKSFRAARSGRRLFAEIERRVSERESARIGGGSGSASRVSYISHPPEKQRETGFTGRSGRTD